jgi:hypothetical protein
MFSSLKIAIVITLIAFAGTGFLWIKKLQGDLETARANVAKMEVAVQISEASIATLQADVVRSAELNTTLQKDLQKAEQYGDELRATLQKHNLTMLALKKPAMIEQRMQDATNKIWDDIAADTGLVGVQPVAPGTKNSNSN